MHGYHNGRRKQRPACDICWNWRQEGHPAVKNCFIMPAKNGDGQPTKPGLRGNMTVKTACYVVCVCVCVCCQIHRIQTSIWQLTRTIEAHWMRQHNETSWIIQVDCSRLGHSVAVCRKSSVRQKPTLLRWQLAQYNVVCLLSFVWHNNNDDNNKS